MSEESETFHWNYRVIEFVDPNSGEPWRSIHEVHYQHGRPVAYSEQSADVTWDVVEGDSAAHHILDLMRTALVKTVLFEKHFIESKAKIVESLPND